MMIVSYLFEYNKYKILIILNIVDVLIGFEQTEYPVNESDGSFDVYVKVFDPPDYKDLPMEIGLTIQTIAITAGKNRLF